MTEWRKDPEFSEAIEKATAERSLLRLERIEAREQGWQSKSPFLAQVVAWTANKADRRFPQQPASFRRKHGER